MPIYVMQILYMGVALYAPSAALQTGRLYHVVCSVKLNLARWACTGGLSGLGSNTPVPYGGGC